MASYEAAKPESRPVLQKGGIGFRETFTSANALFFVFGLAFFYAWNLIDIYAQPIIAQPLEGGRGLWASTAISSISNASAYIALALLLYRVKRFKTVALGASAVAGACGVAAFVFAAVFPDCGESAFLVYRSVSRICAACVIVAWGAKYSELGSIRITVYTLASFLIACVSYLVVDATEGFLRALVVSLLLPFSMVMFCKVGPLGSREPGTGAGARSFVSTTWRVLLVFYLFGIITWIVILNSQGRLGFGEPMGTFVAVGCFFIILVLLVVSIKVGSTFSLSYIYKLVLPMVMVGVALIIAFSFDRSIGPAFVSVGFTCFDLFCFVMIADAAGKTKTDPIKAFGWCRAIESGLPLLSLGVVFVAQAVFNVEENMLIYLFVIACVVVMAVSVVLGKSGIFERAHLNPEIDYPRAEVLVFAQQCEKAIESYALSAREAEVLSLLVRGRSVPHIAERLYIARSTVKTHITRIYQKFGVESRQEMIDVIESLEVSASFADNAETGKNDR